MKMPPDESGLAALTDDELVQLAFERRREALYGNRDAYAAAHEAERELRRRTGFQSLPMGLDDAASRAPAPPADSDRRWWKFWG